ncbi:filamentous hemagglutinin N-terminal domain-containing protein [Klebsiella pneumoniae]
MKKTFKFKASYVALAAVLTSSVVYADPTSYTHSSGATVIDIEKPNAAGVSHNLYRDFNVGANGTILNNSGDDVSHSTFGNIARNNNLTDGSASVILNEVTSKNASSLKGFIEVNGQKADVVIANPNGITCSGCSFVNTNKAILTTGKVNMTDDGAIGSYTVTGGTLTIGENGMNAANGYAVLLADAIKINGKVQANNALVSAGNFTMDNSSGSVTSAGKKATLIQMTVNPQYSIDVSSLGGIEANSISMVGNNIGFGVRNKGSIISNGTLMLTSNGNLLNKGSITGKGLLSQVSTVTGITNDGSIAGAYYLMLSSGDYIVNTGSLSGGQLIATANGNITNGDSGTMTGTSGLSLTSGGKIRNEEKASLLSNNQIAATAIGDFLNEGKISAKHTSLTFVGDSFKNTGNINSTGQTTIQSLTQDGSANTGEIYNLGNITGENINLQTNGTLAQSSSGRIEATNAITAHSYWLNQNGYMNAADITTDHGVVNNYGNITAKNISITTYSDITNEGQISSTGDLTLNTKNKGAIYNYSTLSAGGNMTLTATKVVNGGKSCGILGLAKCGVGTLTADKLVLNSSQKYVSDMGGKQYFKSTEVNTVK